MKAFLLISCLIALGAGIWQHRELSELKATENALSNPAKYANSDVVRRPPGEITATFNHEVWYREAIASQQGDEWTALNLLDEFAGLPADVIEKLLPMIVDREASDQEKIDSENKEFRVQLLLIGLKQLSETDPSVAASFLVTKPDDLHLNFGELGHELCRRSLPLIMSAWVRRDLNAAQTWFAEQEKLGRFEEEPLYHASRSAQTTLTAAMAVYDTEAFHASDVRGYDEAQMRDFVSNAHAFIETNEKRLALAQTILTLSPGLGRDQALDALGKQWAESLPFSESSAIVDSLETASAIDFWIAAQSKDASYDQRFGWYADRSDNERSQRIEQLISHWTKNDFNAIADWLGRLPESRDRDSALAAFAGEVAATEPPSAVDWALEIGDQTVRDATLARLLDRWIADDEAAARTYFEEKGIQARGP